MHFVNTDCAFRPIAFAARFHPLVIAPGVALEIVNKRTCRFTVLIEKRERIALEQKRAGVSANLEFVMRALLHAGQKQFPHAAADKFPHRINAAIPAVEIADHTDALRIRCPNREVNAGRIAHCP